MDTNKIINTRPAASKRALTLVFLIMLMDVIGIFILGPVAPYIVKQYSGNALTVTMLTVIYAGAMFFAAPALGKISDRFGRRPVLLASVLGSAIGYFIFGIGGALWVLFVSRLIDGITGGNMSTATAYIADISRPEERSKNFGLIGMAYGFGLILGPALGGVLGQINLNAPIIAAGVISLVSVVLIYFLLPESLPKEKRVLTPLQGKDFNPFVSIGDMLRKPGVALILVVSMLFNFSFDGINSTTGIFVIDKFAAQPWSIGLLYALSGIAIALGQMVIVNHLKRILGEKRTGVTSLLAGAAGGLLIFFVPAYWMWFPLIFVQFLGISAMFSVLNALATNQVTAREQGQLAGVFAAVNGLVAALGPLWAGLVYDKVMPGSPLWMGAIVFAAAGLILSQFGRVKGNKKQSLATEH